MIERLEKDRIGDVKVAIIAAFGDLGAVAMDAVPSLERYAADRTWARFARPALESVQGEKSGG